MKEILGKIVSMCVFLWGDHFKSGQLHTHFPTTIEKISQQNEVAHKLDIAMIDHTQHELTHSPHTQTLTTHSPRTHQTLARRPRIRDALANTL